MAGIDLNNVSEEKLAKIKAILAEDDTKKETIKEEYLSGLKSIKQADDYESIGLDTKGSFEQELSMVGRLDGSNFRSKRERGLLSSDDKTTYSQLESIHESGTPGNFWDKIRNVVESKKNIRVNYEDDMIDENLLK
jgi:hypothetical protein